VNKLRGGLDGESQPSTLPRIIMDEAVVSRDAALERLRSILVEKLGPGADVRIAGDSVVVGGVAGDEYGGKPVVVSAAIEAAKG